MSTVADLPASCRDFIEYRRPPRITGSNLAQAGQVLGSTLSWTAIPDADIEDFVNAVAGIAETFTVLGTSATRIVPLRHPRFTNLIAVSLDFEALPLTGPDADPDDPSVWQYWRGTVQFESPKYDLSGSKAFLTESFAQGTRAMPLPGQPAGHPVPTQQYTLTTHNMPAYDPSVYQAYVNCVNSSTFLGCAAGTVLYRAPGGQRESTLGNTTTYEVGHTFEICPIEWNKEYNAAGALATYLRADSTPRYAAVNLAALFS